MTTIEIKTDTRLDPTGDDNPANIQPTRFRLEISKRGLPCLWEKGGGASNTGEAVIIADPYGKPLEPIYIRRSGHLAGGSHALIPVERDCVVIKADHHRGDFTIRLYRLTGIRTDEGPGGWFWPATLFAEFYNGEWDNEAAAEAYAAAIKAAEEKATCYHCREPHYVADGENQLHPTMMRVGHCYGLNSVGWYDKPAPATVAQARRAVRVSDKPLATHWDSESQEYLRDATA